MIATLFFARPFDVFERAYYSRAIPLWRCPKSNLFYYHRKNRLC